MGLLLNSVLNVACHLHHSGRRNIVQSKSKAGPSAAKAAVFLATNGTAKAVPFNRKFYSFTPSCQNRERINIRELFDLLGHWLARAMARFDFQSATGSGASVLDPFLASACI